MARIEADMAHKEGATGGRFSGRAGTRRFGAKLLFHTSHHLALGRYTATDYNYYSKRLISAVC